MSLSDKIEACISDIKSGLCCPRIHGCEQNDSEFCLVRQAFERAGLLAEGAQTRTDVEPGLTPDEQKAQAARCGCKGGDDYCPCQNVADSLTKAQRSTVRAGYRYSEAVKAARTPPTDAPGMSREAVEKVLADYFGLRPYAEMAADRADLRGKIRDGYDVNEPTKSDLADAADAILALALPGGEQEAVAYLSPQCIKALARGGVVTVFPRAKGASKLPLYASPVRGAGEITDAQIKHMVDRFLGWKLPENFRPDGGVQFDADAAKKLDQRNLRYQPYGTNLFDAQQAEAMVRHMVEGLGQ